MAISFERYFVDLPDPRREQGKRHQLSDMIILAVCAVICAADTWSDIVDFSNAKHKWFKTFLQLPHGIPSQDTFERVFARIDPEAFEACFAAWTLALAGSSGGKLIAIDGKKIRRSFEHAWSNSTATHLVSAFVDANATVLGQLAVETKENEIVAIPKLLELLDLREAVVTIDAMGCQTAIARQIVEAGGDYVLAVKANQPTLHRAIQTEMCDMRRDDFADVSHDHHRSVDGGHGRVETREVWATDDLSWLGAESERWSGLQSVVMIESTPQVAGGATSRERRYYISSLRADAERLGDCIRRHWGIENRLHYILDVAFSEDDARHRKGHSAQNFSRLRRVALNLLQREKTKKRGIKGKRLNASWDHDYLLKLLTG